LNCFELASGIKVNFLKIRIGGVGVDQTSIFRFVAILNCEVMKILFKYLGMPVEGCHKKGAFCDEVVDRVKNILASWKSRFVSWLGGFTCLS